MIVLFFDTETTGLPLWKEPSSDPQQPHILQICGALFRDDDHLLRSINTMVRPDGFDIPDEITELTGITREDAEMFGVSEQDAYRQISDMIFAADLVVGHNVSFDKRIVRIAAKRFGDEIAADVIKEAKAECTMRQAHKVMGGKWPKLGEACEHFFGQAPDGLHNAMTDVIACRRLWLHLRDLDREAA